MPDAADRSLLEVLLESWERNQTIMLDLLCALPEGGLEARAMEGSPSIAQHFTHIHYERLVSVFEEAPEFAKDVPDLPEEEWPNEEWQGESNKEHLAQMLTSSAGAVRDAVAGRVLAGRELDLNYDHPVLMLQLLLWHEGYHHGQSKLALKLEGHPISDDEAEPMTWDVWRDRKAAKSLSVHEERSKPIADMEG